MSLIPTQAMKQMTVLILNADGSPATGKSVDCSIRRASDGQWWNGTGSTWQATKYDNAMTEIGNGLYYFNFSSTGVGSSNDIFVVYYEETTIPAYVTEEFYANNLWNGLSDISTNIDVLFDVTCKYGGQIQTWGSNSPSQFKTNLPSSVDGFYVDMMIVFNTGPNDTQVRRIVDYDGTNKIVTVDRPFNTTPGDGNHIYVLQRYTPQETSMQYGIVVTDGSNTSLTFKTDLPSAVNDFYNDLQILFLDGALKGQARRISDYVSATKFITVDTAFSSTPSGDDPFVIISRFTSAGSALTPSAIASAVWSEDVPGPYTGQDAGKVLSDVLVDSNEIQGKLPSKAKLRGTADSDGGFDTADLNDIQTQATASLVAYDPPTKAELDTAEANIIAEINVNEGKIDNIQTDINTILSRIGLPPTDLWTDIKAEIDANEALIITLTGNLATHDTDIKSIIGTPIVDLMTDMNNRFDLVDAQLLANYNAIIQIQNNITTVFIVPERLVRPDTGTKPYKFIVLNYDSVGNMEDFDADPSIKGDYVSGGSYFASTTMTKIGTGHYEHTINVAFDDTLGAVAVQVDAVEGGNPRVLIRVTEVTDYDDELAEIKADTGAIYIKTGAGTPSPTIPEQLTSMEGHLTSEIDENQAIVETIRDDVEGVISWANPGFIKSGYSIIDSENPILTGATELPLVPGTGETFSSDGGIIIVDKDGPNEEQLYYSGIVDDVITMSPTSKDHDVGESIYELTRMMFHIALRRKDGQPNIQADSLPSFSIVHDLVGVEKTSTMAWEAAEGRYIGYIDYTLDVVAGKRSGTIGVEVDGQTRDYPFDFELCLRPASEKQINEAIGGAIPPSTIVFDHDGWIDEFGIKHEWTDEMAGPIRDDAGQPLICRIKAYLYDPVDVNVPILGPNPPYDNFTNQFGHYVGGLPSGKYLFTFIANGKKWKQVDRYIDYP